MKQVIPINAIGGDDIAPAITAHYHKAGGNDFTPHERNHIPHLAILEIEMNEPKVIQVANLVLEQEGRFSNPQRGRVYSPDGLSPCIDNMSGGNREPKIMQIGSYSPSSACNAKVLDTDGICPTLLDHKGMEPAILTPIRTEEQRQLRKQGIDTFGGRQMLPRTDGVSNTITTVQKDNLLKEPIKIRQATAQGYIECPPGGGFDASYPNSKLRRGRVQDNGNVVGAITASADSHCVYEGKSIVGYTRDNKGNVQNYHEREIAGTLHTSSGQGGNTDQFVKEQVIGSMQANAMRGSIDGVSPCLTEAMGMGGGQIPMIVQNKHGYNNGGVFIDESPTVTSSAFQDNNHLVETRYRIRKLTPKECLRLMGVDDADIEKMKSAKLTMTLKNGKVKERPMPKTQLYKMAGNSIVVDVLYHLFHQMFIAEPPERETRQLTIFDYL